jgi:DNA-binding NarL/FixJ family response regulator
LIRPFAVDPTEASRLFHTLLIHRFHKVVAAWENFSSRGLHTRANGLRLSYRERVERGLSQSGVKRRAVLFDPYPLWLDAVELVLTRIGFDVVGKATFVKQAIDMVKRHRPDLLIAEPYTASSDGSVVDCLRRAREVVPDVKAIVLSVFDDSEHIEQALGAGATAYVVKTAHPDDFAAAVRQAFTNSIYFAGSKMRVAHPDTSSAVDTAELTRRELEILRLVAEGLSNADLARRLWVTEQTVKFHLSNIYRKLGVSNRTEASRWAQIHGLLPVHSLLQTSAA